MNSSSKIGWFAVNSAYQEQNTDAAACRFTFMRHAFASEVFITDELTEIYTTIKTEADKPVSAQHKTNAHPDPILELHTLILSTSTQHQHMAANPN